MQKKKPVKRVFNRIHFLYFIIIIINIFIILRLFNLQIVKYGYYEALASGQHGIFEELVPERGEIYVEDKFSKKLYPMAINKKMNLLYAVPKEIEDKNSTATLLAPLLSMTKDEILAHLTNNEKAFDPIKHRVETSTIDQINNLTLKGIYAQSESWRYYPDKNLASQIMGFVGFVNDKRQGQYGVEGYYDNVLGGKEGYLETEKDSLSQLVSAGKDLIQGATDGSDIVLTIDRLIQDKVETVLKDAVQKYGAEKGSIIIMDPQTGAITAMANYPNFDPNEYGKVENVDIFSNSSIYELYEPGSTFKPLVVSAALDQKLLTPDTKFKDPGSIKIGEYTIQNYNKKAFGELTTTQVLENSNNIGMVQIAQLVGREKLYNYIINYGFDELSGIDLDTEIPSLISKPKDMRDIDLATLGFGQGIATTPLRLINAFSAIANGGKLLKPYIVKKIIKTDGTEENIKPKAIRQVIEPSTTSTLSAMLVNVIENGFGGTVKMPGYKIAGKSGTAQVSSQDKKGYDPNKKITSFVGFGPIEYPRFVILVKLNNPGGDVWAEDNSAQVFKQLTQELLKYYQIAPSNN